MDKKALEELLASTDRSGASALYLIPSQPPVIRVQGTLVTMEAEPVAADAIDSLCRSFLFDDQLERAWRGHEVHVLYTTKAGDRFRTVAMRQEGGLALVLRRVPSEIPDFERLGLPELLSSFIEFQSGLVLLTGFLGSGKSTTLASMVDRMNQTTNDHIVVIERPIEYVYQPRSALLHQREVGVHVASYPAGIDDAVSHGADVVVVGDLDSYETLLHVLEAAERGLLVLTTLHASSVVGGLYDLVALCPVEDRGRVRVRLASVLRAMMSQTLIRRSQTKGRVPLLEIVINNQSVRQHIRAGSFQELPKVMEKSRGLGMQTVDHGLRVLLARNLISLDEALYHATNRDVVAGSTGRRLSPAMR